MAINPDEQDDEYSDDEEYKDNFLDEQREVWEEQVGNMPSQRRPDSLFSLFKDVWRTNDSSKVGNLSGSELGELGISVRHAQEIANFSRYLKHKAVSNHFSNLSEIILSTSMSKKGWFVELFVTSKKFAHKGTLSGTTGQVQQQQKQKWRIFGKGNTAQTQPTNQLAEV